MKNKQPTTFLDKIENYGIKGGSIFMRILGPVLVVSLYLLIALHVYAFFTIITPLLKKRLGTELGLTWIVVGLALLYNIVWNHSLAVILKPGSTYDLKQIEGMRNEQKQRAFRKSIEDDLDDDSKEDRFAGLSKDVKRLLRYR